MKKKSILVGLALAAVGALSLASCTKKHTHEFTEQVAESQYLAKEATCTSKAQYYYSCKDGEKGTETFEYGEVKAHNLETDAAKAATCTETGLTEGAHCKDCGAVVTPQTTVDALGHQHEALPAVDPTCEETGLTKGDKCPVCNTVLTPQTEVEANGHTIKDGECVVCKKIFATDGLVYQFDSTKNVYNIVEYTGTDKVIRIPGTYKGADDTEAMPVVLTGSSSTSKFVTNLNAAGVTKVIFEEGVTEIGSNALYNASTVTEVVFPSTLKKIGNYAFYSTILTSITLPEGLETIGDYSIHCTKGSFETVSIPASVKSIGVLSFYSPNLKEYNVDENNEKYSSKDADGNDVLIYNKDNKNLVAFAPKCNKEVKLPEGVTRLGTYSLAYYVNEEYDLVVPKTVNAIGNSAFKDSKLKSISFEDGSQYTTVASYVFYCLTVDTIILPSSVNLIGTTIGQNAKINNLYVSGVSDVTINAEWSKQMTTVPEIKYYGVTDGTILSYDSSLDKYMFVNYTGSATDVVVCQYAYDVNGMKEVGFYANSGTDVSVFGTAATKVTLKGALNVPAYLFNGATVLTTLEIDGNVSFDEKAFVLSSISNISVNEGNEVYTVSEDGKYLMTDNGKELVYSADGKVPSSVYTLLPYSMCKVESYIFYVPTQISYLTGAFNGNGKIEVIVFEDEGEYSDCYKNEFVDMAKLECVVFNYNANDLAENSFVNCPKLRSINLACDSEYSSKFAGEQEVKVVKMHYHAESGICADCSKNVAFDLSFDSDSQQEHYYHDYWALDGTADDINSFSYKNDNELFYFRAEITTPGSYIAEMDCFNMYIKCYKLGDDGGYSEIDMNEDGEYDLVKGTYIFKVLTVALSGSEYSFNVYLHDDYHNNNKNYTCQICESGHRNIVGNGYDNEQHLKAYEAGQAINVTYSKASGYDGNDNIYSPYIKVNLTAGKIYQLGSYVDGSFTYDVTITNGDTYNWFEDDGAYNFYDENFNSVSISSAYKLSVAKTGTYYIQLYLFNAYGAIADNAYKTDDFTLNIALLDTSDPYVINSVSLPGVSKTGSITINGTEVSLPMISGNVNYGYGTNNKVYYFDRDSLISVDTETNTAVYRVYLSSTWLATKISNKFISKDVLDKVFYVDITQNITSDTYTEATTDTVAKLSIFYGGMYSIANLGTIGTLSDDGTYYTLSKTGVYYFTKVIFGNSFPTMDALKADAKHYDMFVKYMTCIANANKDDNTVIVDGEFRIINPSDTVLTVNSTNVRDQLTGKFAKVGTPFVATVNITADGYYKFSEFTMTNAKIYNSKYELEAEVECEGEATAYLAKGKYYVEFIFTQELADKAGSTQRACVYHIAQDVLIEFTQVPDKTQGGKVKLTVNGSSKSYDYLNTLGSSGSYDITKDYYAANKEIVLASDGKYHLIYDLVPNATRFNNLIKTYLSYESSLTQDNYNEYVIQHVDEIIQSGSYVTSETVMTLPTLSSWQTSIGYKFSNSGLFATYFEYDEEKNPAFLKFLDKAYDALANSLCPYKDSTETSYATLSDENKAFVDLYIKALAYNDPGFEVIDGTLYQITGSALPFFMETQSFSRGTQKMFYVNAERGDALTIEFAQTAEVEWEVAIFTSDFKQVSTYTIESTNKNYVIKLTGNDRLDNDGIYYIGFIPYGSGACTADIKVTLSK